MEIEFNIPVKMAIGDISDFSGISKKINALDVNKTALKKSVEYIDEYSCRYRENLDILENLGVRLKSFSPLKDKKLPAGINGIYIGGGYPELYCPDLERNNSIKKEIKRFAENYGLIYAECGGLMYLGKSIRTINGKNHEMTGIFPWVTEMSGKVGSFGYREITITKKNHIFDKNEQIRGHEFHYSKIKLYESIPTLYEVKGGRLDNIKKEGFILKNTLASFIHIHFAGNIKFAEGLINLC